MAQYEVVWIKTEESKKAEKASCIKRKCINLSATEKLEVLNRLAQGESLRKLSKELNVTERTIQNWAKNRKSLEKLKNEGGILQNKRRRELPYEKLEKAVYIWFCEMKMRGRHVSGPSIKTKALELSADMNIGENFVASEGWIRNWKARHHIRQIPISSEKMSADSSAAEEFKKKLSALIKERDLTLAQIFDFDETGILFKMLPPVTLTEKEDREIGEFKGNKDRCTVGVCSNAVGTCKLPLVLIGKSEKPRAIKNLSKASLPVYYTHQKNAWMEARIFETWFEEAFVPFVKNFLHEEGLPPRAILLLDNAPGHPDIDVVKSGEIEAYFIPPNTTNLVQPMAQGIIANLKRRYRFKLLTAAIANQEKDVHVTSFQKSVNIRDAINWISDAWNETSKDSIFDCWRPLITEFIKEKKQSSTADGEIGIKNVLVSLKQLKGYENVSEEIVNDWIHNDYSLFEMPSNHEIITMATETVDPLRL